MRELSVNLQDFSLVHEDGSRRSVLSPLLRAARNGDAEELRKLLHEKSNSPQPGRRFVYPEDWKYHFSDLVDTRDHEGRTALHLAAVVGNHEMALESVKAILESIQLLADDEEGTSIVKHSKLVNTKDKNKETALHLAIENRALDVVAYLIENQANIIAKDSDGTEALLRIYKTLPDAMKEVYNNSLQLTEDHRKFLVDWGPIVGFRHKGTVAKTAKNEDYKEVPGGGALKSDENWWSESEYLKYVLNSNKWGPPVLLHPLLKLYLELKWKKVQWFFRVSLFLQMTWLLLYAAAFVTLHLRLKSTKAHNSTSEERSEDVTGGTYYSPWILMIPFTLVCVIKEVYQLMILRKAYLSFENVIQVLFILLFWLQLVLLLAEEMEAIGTLSVIAAVLGTVLMILQLGKTPKFGRQVAALKKVLYSFTPQLPVFFVWFLGFGMIFWAIFFNADKSWVVGMVAIMAAMVTGELNAKEHFENDVKEGDAGSIRQIVGVSSVLFFVIVIVVLYFNVLTGYAVSDIQVLEVKAEALELSNQLSTIYTIENFLISRPGMLIVNLKCRLQRLFCRTASDDHQLQPLDSIYVLPPWKFRESKGFQELSFHSMSDQLMMQLKDIAYANLKREKENDQQMRDQLLKHLELNESELRLVTSGLRY